MVNCNDTIRLSNVGIEDHEVANSSASEKSVPLRSAMVGSVIFCLEALRRLQANARDRKVLQHLDDNALKDVGMTRADRDQELSRTLWTGFPPRR